MLWYLGYGTRYLLMGHKLLVVDNNYKNTELRKWIAYHVMIVWLLVYARLCPLIMLCCYCCILLIAITLICVGHDCV